MLKRLPVLAVHAAPAKLLHYVRLRAHEASQGLNYRAGLFVPASQIDALLLDLALIYDALLDVDSKAGSAATGVPDAQTQLAAACDVAAEEFRQRRPDITGVELCERAKALHRRYLAQAESLPGLASVVEAVLLRPFGHEGKLSSRQRQVRHHLALVLSLEAQVVRSSALSALGVAVEIGQLVDDRDQHLYLFCDRYGCLNKAELGEELDHEPEDDDASRDLPLPNDMLKRTMDFFGSLAIMLLLSPLYLFIYLMIKLEDGPALYNQKRVGRYGRVFPCWKFRTMVPGAEQMLEKILAEDPAARAEYEKYSKLKNDPRITPIGRFLRKTSLDELPQLFNVLVGEMSLVGPRPIAVGERDRWGIHFRTYKSLRPGLTGPWQLKHRSSAPYHEQFQHAALYAREWSLWKDVRYLIATVAVPFKQRGAY